MPKSFATATTGRCSYLRYVVSPAHHRHCVCIPEEQSLRAGCEHLYATPSNNLVSHASLPAELMGRGAYMQDSTKPLLVAGRVGFVASSHLGVDRFGPQYSSHGLSVRATPILQAPNPEPQGGEDKPSPAQLSVILLKLREEVM